MSGLQIFVRAFVSLPVLYASCLHAEPAAIVEDASASVTAVQPMDILEAGRKITLPEGGQLTLGYFQTCLREKISGGEVTIGSEKSIVTGGKRDEEPVDCDGGPRIIPAKHGAETAGAVFRKGKSPRKTYPKPDWTLYGTEPVFLFSDSAEQLLIERLDRDDEKPFSLAVSGKRVDSAEHGITLDPGGLYVLTSGKSRYIVKVSPLATKGAPFLSRLVPM